MTKPIPKNLLPHNVTVEKAYNIDRDGNTQSYQYGLECVRVVPTVADVRASLGLTTSDSVTLIVDAVNSHWENSRGLVPNWDKVTNLPAIGDSVLWQGGKFTVKSVTPYYTTGGYHISGYDKADGVHHWEIILV